MSFVDDLIKRVNDTERRLGRLERLDVNPPASSVAAYSGTPVAGAIAYWTGAGTVAGAGTAFYDAANGRIGVGGNDPVSDIESISTSTSATRGITASQHNSGAHAGVFSFRKSRGSRASQTIAANGDFIGDFIFSPFDGTNYLRTAQIAAKAVGTMGSASMPTDLLFATGSNDDASLTNVRMTIKSTGEVGIGIAAPNATILGIEAGTSNNDAAVGGVLYVDSGSHANTLTGEDDLASYSVPASTLSANNMSLWFEAGGTLGANANTKTVRVRFGGGSNTLVFDSGNIGSASDPYWYVKGRIVRTGATAQVCICFGGSKGSLLRTTTVTTDGTLSGACTLKVTGEAVATNDIVQNVFVVGYDDANV